MFTSRFSKAVVQVAQRRKLGHFTALREKYYSNPAAGADNPTYLKEGGDKLFVTVGFAGLALGVSSILVGLLHMSFGTHKE